MNEEGNPLGLNYNYTPTAGDAFNGVVNYLGGVARFYQKTIPQFFTGVRRGIKEEAEAPSPLTNTLNPIQAVGELTTGWTQSESKYLEQVASGTETFVKKTPLKSISEPIAGGVALAASYFIPGMAEVGLISKGGAAVLGLTVQNPKFLAKGIEQGVGQSQLYKAGVQKLRRLESDGIVKRKLYQEQFDTGVINEKQFKNRLAKLKKEKTLIILH